MRRWVLVVLVACFVLAAGTGRSVQGYGSAAHVYIAEHALFTVSSNALYGSMAPDIIGYLPAPYAALFEENHKYYNLVPYAVTLPEKMFALGWMTHNEKYWGGDHFAHVDPGYVVTKGATLEAMLGGEVPPGLGHIAVEIGIDILLKKQDPLLAMKVYQAAALRSNSIPEFLWQAGVLPQELAIPGEATFRTITEQYALALFASTPTRLGPMATFASQMASEIYGVTITEDEAAGILAMAIGLCQNDYLPTINKAVRESRLHVLRGEF